MILELSDYLSVCAAHNSCYKVQLHVLQRIWMCTSTGSHFCIRLTQRDNLDSDHQPMERGAHAITSERTRPTSQTVAPRGLSRTNAHAQPTEPKQHPARIFHSVNPHHPSVHHCSISRVLLLLLPFTRSTRRMCAQGPPTASYWAECWLDGDYGGELESWVRQPVRGKVWAAGTLLSPQIVSLQ